MTDLENLKKKFDEKRIRIPTLENEGMQIAMKEIQEFAEKLPKMLLSK